MKTNFICKKYFYCGRTRRESKFWYIEFLVKFATNFFTMLMVAITFKSTIIHSGVENERLSMTVYLIAFSSGTREEIKIFDS